MPRAPLAIIVLFIAIASASIADEVIVPASDRDRIIRLKDGRQINLRSGRELARLDDGRLVARIVGSDQNLTAKAAEAEAVGGGRWLYYGAALVGGGSIKRGWDIKTAEVNVPVKFEGESFTADGRNVKISKSLSETYLGAAFGVKDSAEGNYYELSVAKEGDLTELLASAAIGISKFSLGKGEPYIRAFAGAGFDGSFGSPDYFAFGAGLGAGRALSDRWEIFAEIDYLMRVFGEVAGYAAKPGAESIQYGNIKRDETEVRFFAGARYLFN